VRRGNGKFGRGSNSPSPGGRSEGAGGGFPSRAPRPNRPAPQPKPTRPQPPTREKLDISAATLAPIAPPQAFLDAAASLGIEFEPGDVEKLGLYLAMLMHANESQNLTAIRDSDEAWTRHILDSLTLIPMIVDFPEGAAIADVGTGGGLPGMPLAIALPAYRFTLMDATSKKCDFLRQVVERLDLKNVTVVCGRAEVIGHDRGARTTAGGIGHVGGHREKYDLVVARAVGRLATLAELTVPLAKVGGRVVLIKGQKADEEVREATKALHLLKAVHTGTDDTPTGRVVVLDKRSATPRDYPRANGEPSRAPLGITVDKDKRRA
jgi:16S rRNA (guanine527-N7)-methyltransferase